MPDLAFAQPARRNLALPIALTVAIVAAALFALLRFTPHRTANLAIDRTAVYAAHTVFKSDSIVVGHDSAQDDLYVIADLRLTDNLRLPLFIDDITATLTPSNDDPAGSAPHSHQRRRACRPPQPLHRLPQGQEGWPTPPALPSSAKPNSNPAKPPTAPSSSTSPSRRTTWNNRQDATLTLTLYHQPPITVTIPRQPHPSPTPTAK